MTGKEKKKSPRDDPIHEEATDYFVNSGKTEPTKQMQTGGVERSRVLGNWIPGQSKQLSRCQPDHKANL